MKARNFVPPNKSEAKKSLTSTNFGLFENEYDLKRLKDLYDHLKSKEH
jgi:hypothetical protein